MERRVVITGIGPVTSIGIGKDTFLNYLLEHGSRINVIDNSVNHGNTGDDNSNCSVHINIDKNININNNKNENKNILQKVPDEFEKNYKFKSRYYMPAPEIALADYGVPQMLESAMEKTAKYSVAAARLALEDAGYEIKERDKYFCIDNDKDWDILVGVGMGSLQTALDSYLSHISGESEPATEYKPNTRFNRMVIPMLMPNSASAWISILFGLKGSNFTINASCASGTYAVGEAYKRIAGGICTRALAGGVECLQERYGAIMRGFDVLATLTRSDDGNPMPFSSLRSGFLFNEGAGCMLVLEELETARARGAEIYAEILGYESNSDAFNIVQMRDSGEQIALMLRKLVKDRKIDYFNTHGTATQLNDEIEARVIKDIFGAREHQPLLNSTKGILGHSIGASGAIEAAVTALSIHGSKVHGNIIREPMEDLNLVLQSKDAEVNYAITSSYGFGGHNGAILMKRYEDK